MSKPWKQRVVESFDRGADVYAQHDNAQVRIAEFLSQHLPQIDAPSVLELGCGTGNLTRYLLDVYSDAQFTISDISESMVTKARSDIGDFDNVNWRVMDAEHIQCNEKYDLIVSSMTAQWFFDFEEAVAQQRAFLKPGGYIMHAVPGEKTFQEWQNVLEDLNLPSGLLDFSYAGDVIAEDIFTLSYESGFDFLKSVKAMGAQTPREGYKPLTQVQMRKALSLLEKIHANHISWHALVLMAKA